MKQPELTIATTEAVELQDEPGLFSGTPGGSRDHAGLSWAAETAAAAGEALGSTWFPGCLSGFHQQLSLAKPA